jgi:hypothetical protein
MQQPIIANKLEKLPSKLQETEEPIAKLAESMMV